MHFSREAFKGTHLTIKTETSPGLDENEPDRSSTGGCPILYPEDEQFIAFQQLNPSPEDDAPELITSIRYFFPSVEFDQINNRLNDGANLTNSVEHSLKTSSTEKIDLILEEINKLSPVEKLLLYLKLPTGKNEPDPSKQSLNPLGGRPEIFETIAWIKTNMKEDREISIPKQDVYNQYTMYCSLNGIKPLATADFGKVMKQVYPSVRPRRLGTRGNSRYCYSGMSSRTSLPPPILPIIRPSSDSTPSQDSCTTDEGGGRTCAWAAQILGTPIGSLSELEAHLASHGLPISTSLITQDPAYIASAKVFTGEKKPSYAEGKKKEREDSSSSNNKTPPERCKGKRRSGGKRSGGGDGSKKKLEEATKRTKSSQGEGRGKVAIPRLVKIARSDASSSSLAGRRQKQKPLQPKQEPFIENGNSLEQEEELLKYFQSGGEEQKTGVPMSQLRMLLERKDNESGGSQSRRRVSFETVPESPKKFSFEPISPVSPFIQPPQRVLLRSSSVNSPEDKPTKKQPALSLPPPLPRSQSVPMVLPQITPVPAETIDFGLDSTDSSNFLVMDESSGSLLIDSHMNNDNLNTIFSLITEIETERSRSYPATPTAPRTSFFDEIDCDQSLSELAHLQAEVADEVYHSGSSIQM